MTRPDLICSKAEELLGVPFCCTAAELHGVGRSARAARVQPHMSRFWHTEAVFLSGHRSMQRLPADQFGSAAVGISA